ncbi:hypothetical protein OBBRIDRAFT_803465 [Obba rivulosa]|uniref:Uncharacterized protein n=1 Tax=Obba rivulosa TaxID=1052685 RepID=A0A8E2AZV2_9APHY|nr:hypothetical protein OBBRIDRAFT_803465 [Obba rivulosa]
MAFQDLRSSTTVTDRGDSGSSGKTEFCCSLYYSSLLLPVSRILYGSDVVQIMPSRWRIYRSRDMSTNRHFHYLCGQSLGAFSIFYAICYRSVFGSTHAYISTNEVELRHRCSTSRLSVIVMCLSDFPDHTFALDLDPWYLGHARNYSGAKCRRFAHLGRARFSLILWYHTILVLVSISGEGIAYGVRCIIMYMPDFGVGRVSEISRSGLSYTDGIELITTVDRAVLCRRHSFLTSYFRIETPVVVLKCGVACSRGSHAQESYLELVNSTQGLDIATSKFSGSMEQRWSLESYLGAHSIRNIEYGSYISAYVPVEGKSSTQYLRVSEEPFGWRVYYIDGCFIISPAPESSFFWNMEDEDLGEIGLIVPSSINTLWKLNTIQLAVSTAHRSPLHKGSRLSSAVMLGLTASHSSIMARSSGRNHDGAIIGGVLGGSLGVLVLVLVLIFWRKKWSPFNGHERRPAVTAPNSAAVADIQPADIGLGPFNPPANAGPPTVDSPYNVSGGR